MKTSVAIYRRMLVITLIFAMVSGAALAFNEEDPGGGGIESPDAPSSVPLDGGVSILIAAGVAYGIKRINDSSKENKIL